MLAGERSEKVNSARVIEEQLGLGVADNLRHLARELAIGDSQGVGRDVHVRILSWRPGSRSAHTLRRDGWPPRSPCRNLPIAVERPGPSTGLSVVLSEPEAQPPRPSSLLHGML